MDVFTKAGERLIDQTVALEEAATPEALGDDQYRIVPPIACAGVSDVLERVVRDQDLGGREGLLQAFTDCVAYAHGSTCRKGRTATSS